MEPTTSGDNRTGAAVAADGVRAMLEANERWAPNQVPDTTLADEERRLYILESDPVGSIPPPATIPGMLKTGLQKMMGDRPEMLMDKIGERIAFERGGTRLRMQAHLRNVMAEVPDDAGPMHSTVLVHRDIADTFAGWWASVSACATPVPPPSSRASVTTAAST